MRAKRNGRKASHRAKQSWFRFLFLFVLLNWDARRTKSSSKPPSRCLTADGRWVECWSVCMYVCVWGWEYMEHKYSHQSSSFILPLFLDERFSNAVVQCIPVHQAKGSVRLSLGRFSSTTQSRPREAFCDFRWVRFASVRQHCSGCKMENW